MKNKLIQFVCIKRTKLSGQRDFTEIGELFWADFNMWKSNNFIDLWGDEEADYFTSRLAYGKSNCFIPLYQWRRNRINSILEDD